MAKFYEVVVIVRDYDSDGADVIQMGNVFASSSMAGVAHDRAVEAIRNVYKTSKGMVTTMQSAISNEILDTLKADGLKIYMRKPTDEYAYVTDGVRIAYIQWSARTSVATVHIPNKYTGTGFQMFDSITPEKVRIAMDTDAPEWATRSDRNSVKKYKDWASFHNTNSWNAGLQEVD